MRDLFDVPASARTYAVRWPSTSPNRPFITPHVGVFDAYVKAVRSAGLLVGFSSPFLAVVHPCK